jgi:hypothetical protein
MTRKFVFLSLVFVELKIFFDFKINSVKGRKKPKVFPTRSFFLKKAFNEQIYIKSD